MKASSGAFLLRDGLVLLGLRSPARSSYPSLWDAIGGHAESGETLTQALIRELSEEIQVIPVEFYKLATLTDPSPAGSETAHHIFVVTKWTGAGPLLTGDEHSEIRWFEVSEAIKLRLAHPGYVEILQTLGPV